MPVLTPQERQRYAIVAYALVWPLLYGAGTRFVSPPSLGMAIAGFVWLLGFWFLPPRVTRTRFSFLAWLAVSLLFAAAVSSIRHLVERLFHAA